MTDAEREDRAELARRIAALESDVLALREQLAAVPADA